MTSIRIRAPFSEYLVKTCPFFDEFTIYIKYFIISLSGFSNGEEVDFLKHSALDQQVTSIPC